MFLAKKNENKNRSQTSQLDTNEVNEEDANENSIGPRSRRDLLSELKLLAIKENNDSEEFDGNNIFDNKTNDEEENDNNDNL